MINQCNHEDYICILFYCTSNDPPEMILWCFTTQSFLQWDILSHFSSKWPFWIPKSIAISLYSSITINTMLYCTEIGPPEMILWCFTTQSFLQWDILSHFSSKWPFWILKRIAIGFYSSITINTMLYCTEIGPLEMILWRFTTQSFL